MTIQKPEWDRELAYLASVMSEIERQLDKLGDLALDRKESLIDIRKNVWDEFRLDVDSIEMRIETVGDLVRQIQEEAQLARGYKSAQDAAVKLKRLRESAYFGRFDFRENGSPVGTESIYIGLGSLVDDKTGKHLVYDWRAPISSLYYDYTPGPAEYDTPDGRVTGTMELKRQYKIEWSELRFMFDTGIQIGDEMLQHMLGKNADDRMRSIVTTIQREQNQVIRNEKYPVLIVQGAAGSGKTSIALQRIAYMLYKHRRHLSSERMLLFSPNRLFSDYISNVLPELGEANMRQTTFQDYAEYRLGGELRLEDRYERLEYLLTGRGDPDYTTVRAAIRFKSTPDYLELVQRYADCLANDSIVFENLLYNGKVWKKGEQLASHFYERYRHLPMETRLERIKERLLGSLEGFKEERVETMYQRLLREPKYLGTDTELKKMAIKTVAKRIRKLREDIQNGAYLSAVRIYTRLLRDPELLAHAAEGIRLPDEWDAIRDYTLRRLDEGVVPHEDVAPLLYLLEAVRGFDTLNGVRHVTIDEAQDYTPFQFEMFRRMFPRSQMTLLGDLNQTIQPEMPESGYDFIVRLFGAERTGIVRLAKSYRSTEPIVAFTKAMLPYGEAIDAVSRTGDKPSVRVVASRDELPAAVAADLRALRADGMKSIAVLCRSAAESREVHGALSSSAQGDIGELHLLTKDDKEFKSGTVVLPAYLAKGLEFDAVILYDASKDVYAHEEERKLFYTACTRAMHRLHLYAVGEATSFVTELPSDLVELAAYTLLRG